MSCSVLIVQQLQEVSIKQVFGMELSQIMYMLTSITFHSVLPMTEVRIKEPILPMMVVFMFQLILKQVLRPIHVISLRLVWSIERLLKDTEQHNITMV